MAKYGFVYIMTNQKDVYKIGCTERSPYQRSLELSSATGVVREFSVICYGEYADFQKFEALMHSKFSDRRINNRREFFSGPFSDLYEAMKDEGGEFILNFCEGEGPLYVYEEEQEKKGLCNA